MYLRDQAPEVGIRKQKRSNHLCKRVCGTFKPTNSTTPTHTITLMLMTRNCEQINKSARKMRSEGGEGLQSSLRGQGQSGLIPDGHTREGRGNGGLQHSICPTPLQYYQLKLSGS
jgi:hypothetical protein